MGRKRGSSIFRNGQKQGEAKWRGWVARGSWLMGRESCVVCRGSRVVSRVRFKIKEDLLYGKLVRDEEKHSD